MGNDLQITGIFVHRAVLQAQLRGIVMGAANWAQLAENSQYAAGYLAGVMDTVNVVATSAELDVDTPDQSRRLTVNR